MPARLGDAKMQTLYPDTLERMPLDQLRGHQTTLLSLPDVCAKHKAVDGLLNLLTRTIQPKLEEEAAQARKEAAEAQAAKALADAEKEKALTENAKLLQMIADLQAAA